ncbi:MAG: PEP-CTERM sorting domain-containing protein [Opitutales bacterium]|nr:PEP-CTERM sorting domain-containing protein [Opitutales bacterium]
MKSPLTTSLFSLIASAAALSAQGLFDSYDFVRTHATFNTVAQFAADNPVNFEAAGNTISAADFSGRVAAAHAAGQGGVISFENATVVNTGSNTTIANVTMTGSGPVARTNLRAQNLIANLGTNGPSVTIGRGSQWYVEAGGSGNLGTVDGPGSPSSGDNHIDDEWFFEFNENPAQRLPASGSNVLGGPTSWDMTFDALDQILVVGLSYLGRDNFQWFSGQGTPTMYSQATFSDGSTALSQIGLEQQAAGDYDVFVGFEAPDGLFITDLHVWHRGVNNRAFGSIDDIGIIAIPEPRAYALLFAGLAAFLAARMRRRR